MEEQKYEQIFEEVRQLCAQYQNEVPSRRRTWPKSIKERVLQLLQLEQSCEEISKNVGISSATIYSWKSAMKPTAPPFFPVQIVEAPSKPPVPLPPPRQRARRRARNRVTPTIIVIAPNGLRFEGLDVGSALAIADRLGATS